MERMEYRQYLLSEAWLKRRKLVLEFWGYRCSVCNSPTNPQVHHRTYERVGRELLSDLVVLCESCHALFSVSPFKAWSAQIDTMNKGIRN
jgi:5-methylcytosine-specific restriction endonuclease McrA